MKTTNFLLNSTNLQGRKKEQIINKTNSNTNTNINVNKAKNILLIKTKILKININTLKFHVIFESNQSWLVFFYLSLFLYIYS